MKVKVLSDSSCDILSDEKIGFSSVPFNITTSEKNYVDDINLDVEAMINDFKKYKGKSSTACPGVGLWLNEMEGADEVYIITMTSGISGTFNSASIAKEMYLEDHPNAKVAVYDTLSTAAEETLVVEKVLELVKTDNTFEENCKIIEDYIKHTRLFFTLESIRNFAQNGRVSKAVASLVSILGITIFGTASHEGTLEPITKCMKYKQALKSLIENLNEAGFDGGRVIITHVKNEKKALLVRDEILKYFPTSEIKIYKARGLCSYYAELGGVLIGVECKNEYEKIYKNH